MLSDDTEPPDVFNTAPADAIGSFRYPMPISKPLSVVLYGGMNLLTIYSSYSSHLKDLSEDGSLIDMNKIYHDCQNPYHCCMERMWRKVCLNKVVDNLQKMYYERILKRCVKEVYYDTFVLMVNVEILERSDWWESGKNLILPDCMYQGSLREAYIWCDRRP